MDLVINGKPFRFSADNTTPQVHCDGIAIDPTHTYLYYKALTARTLWRVAIVELLNEALSSRELRERAEIVAATELADGLAFDAAGNLYLTSIEGNAIKILRPNGSMEILCASAEFSWPDTISLTADGHLLFSASQFHLMPAFNGGIDKRTPPYNVFRLTSKLSS